MKSSRLALLAICALSCTLAACGGTSSSSEDSSSVDSSTSISEDSSSSSSVDDEGEGEGETSSSTWTGDVELVYPDYTNVDSRIINLVDSVRDTTHSATVHYQVTVTYPDDGSSYSYVDTFISNDVTYQYGYLEDGERACGLSGVSMSGDWDSDTGSPISGRYNTTTTPLTVYWKDSETGLASYETRTLDNRVMTYTIADIDDDGTTVPIIYDDEFANPWDYIDYTDLYVDQDGVIHLDTDQAEFFPQVYSVTGMNTITDAILTTNEDGSLAELELVSEDLEGSTYVRSNEFTITYSYEVDGDTFSHKEPYENENQEIADLFDTFEEAVTSENSFSYDKRIQTYSELEAQDNTSDTGVTGYYTRDGVYFSQWGEYDTNGNHHDDSWKENWYSVGDNYDYAAVPNSEGTYSGYECTSTSSSNEEVVFTWGAIAVSSNAYYTLDSYADIAPYFYEISPAVFIEADSEDEDVTHYTVDDDLLSTIGTYFDFQFLGVHSTTLETGTTSFDLYIEDGENENKILNVQATFSLLDIRATVNFTFDTASIGTTELPSWCNTENGWIG